MCQQRFLKFYTTADPGGSGILAIPRRLGRPKGSRAADPLPLARGPFLAFHGSTRILRRPGGGQGATRGARGSGAGGPRPRIAPSRPCGCPGSGAKRIPLTTLEGCRPPPRPLTTHAQ